MVALVAPTIAGDVALRNELAAGPIGDRSVTVVSTDGARGGGADVDTYVRGLLDTRGLTDAVRLTVVQQVPTNDGGVFRLVGVDDLGEAVRVVSGRFPNRCDEALCEGVLWTRDAAPKAVELDPTLKLTIVGTVARKDDRVLSGTFAPEDRESVVFVDGAPSTASIAALGSVDRSTGWIAAIDPRRMSLAQVPRFLRQLATLGGGNDAVHLIVTAPDSKVRDVARRARITVNRLALPVGQAGAMLAGFANITTFAIRPWHRRGLQVLRLRGSTASEEWRFAATEASLLAVLGAVLGVAIGVAGIFCVAAAADVAVGPALTGVARLRVFGPFVALIALSIGATLLILRGSGEPPRTRSRVYVSDLLGAAAIGVWLFAANRGGTKTTTLANGPDPLLSLTPALACIAAASISIRLLPLLSALLRRLIPARSWATRLAVVDAPRRRQRTLSTAAFVTASLTMATFALGYRTTLQAGSIDQAAFAVPLDITLREGAELVAPRRLRSTRQWSQRINGVFATDVLRRGLSVHRSGTAAETVEVLGVDPESLDRLHSWRDDFGARPRSNEISVSPPPESGVALPSSPRHLTLTSTALASDLEVAMVLARADGTWHESVATPDETRTNWTMEFNPFDQDVRLEGFRVGDLFSGGVGGGQANTVSSVDVKFRSVAVDDHPVSVDWATAWSQAAQLDGSATELHVTATVRGTTDLIFFGEPLDAPVPAIVDPSTASTAIDGVVALEVPNGGRFRVRVEGIANSFPTVGGRFAVVDEATMSAALDRIQPGMGAPAEMWLAAGSSTSLHLLRTDAASSGLATVDHVDRTALESQLSGDTLGRSVMFAFLIAALGCALLSVVALIFVAHSDRLDELDVFRELRTSGATAGELARLLRVRSIVLIATAAPVGLACGVVLLDAVRDLISVSANGTAPVPALRLTIEPALIGALVVGVAFVSLLGTTFVGRAMRSISRHDSLAAHE